MSRKQDALDYHSQGRPGKIEVVPTKAVATQRDLSLAYSPGVAEPCLEIAKDPEKVGDYTARRNLVAVITNGTAVLGLGDIGPKASKPVMEGKGVLFKRFADIDVFDIEIDEKDPQKLIDIIASLEPTFGGINLEDIKAPECFVVEKALRERMKIPVFHDDQHGTAIITAAALKNAAEIQGKNLATVKVVCIGGGAAAIACMELWIRLGVKREHIAMTDSKGVIRQDRGDKLDASKALFALAPSDPRKTLDDVLTGADVMIGLSVANVVSADMVKKMAPKPIIFALANPDPEIPYDVAVAARPDAIVATGRSDFPNQVNNVLGFPYIFRGALDAEATTINTDMCLAAALALAELARTDVPDNVLQAYGGKPLRFGATYIIPKPFDPRALYWVAPAVAEAAMKTGVAKRTLDLAEYREALARKLSPTRRILWRITAAAKAAPKKKIVFPEGTEDKILRAAQILVEEGIAHPVLLGEPAAIAIRASELGLDLKGCDLVHPESSPLLPELIERFAQKRERKGITHADAERILTSRPTFFGMMMVDAGHADGIVSGLTSSYPDTIRPALRTIGVRDGVTHAAGAYMVISDKDVKFLADTTVNIDPDAATIAETAILLADAVEGIGIEPRVAMLSFSNFGDAPHPSSKKMAEATRLVRARRPDLMVDGEMQADVALDAELREAAYGFSNLKGPANVLIFPNLDAGNIAYKLLAAESKAAVIGPILLGMKRPVNVLQRGASVDTIVNVTAITVTSSGVRVPSPNKTVAPAKEHGLSANGSA